MIKDLETMPLVRAKCFLTDEGNMKCDTAISFVTQGAWL